MLNSMLLATFWENYGIWIILVGVLALYFVYSFYRTKKMNQAEQELVSKITIGAKVKTYSGIFGTVVAIKERETDKVVTLKISENAFMDVDFRAIYGVDEPLADVVNSEKSEEKPEEVEVKAEPVVEEKPEEVKEEKVEEPKEEKPKKSKKK